MRHQGRALEALTIATEALDEADRCTWSDQSSATRLYARLERGRCLLELNQEEKGVVELRQVVDGQSLPTAYPRLGAHRSLVRAYRATGNLGAAKEHLRVCLDVAMGDSPNVVLRKVGAVAAAEELVRGSDETTMLASRVELERAWAMCFGGVAVEAVRASWIYRRCCSVDALPCSGATQVVQAVVEAHSDPRRAIRHPHPPSA